MTLHFVFRLKFPKKEQKEDKGGREEANQDLVQESLERQAESKPYFLEDRKTLKLFQQRNYYSSAFFLFVFSGKTSRVNCKGNVQEISSPIAK